MDNDRNQMRACAYTSTAVKVSPKTWKSLQRQDVSSQALKKFSENLPKPRNCRQKFNNSLKIFYKFELFMED